MTNTDAKTVKAARATNGPEHDARTSANTVKAARATNGRGTSGAKQKAISNFAAQGREAVGENPRPDLSLERGSPHAGPTPM